MINDNTYGHTYPELEKRILEKDVELKAKAIKEAKFFGMQNRPGVMDRIEPYVGFIKTGYEDLRAQILQLIQPDMHEAKMRTNGLALEEQRTDVQKQIARMEHENTIALHELDGKVPERHKGKSSLGWIALVVIYLGELVFNAWSFEFIGDGLLFSLLIALGVTVGMSLFAHGIMRLLNRYPEEGYKAYLKAAALAVPAVALIGVLSVWRSQMINAQNEVSVQPAVFAAVNLFMFIASMLVSHFFFPKKEVAAADRELQAKFDAIQEREDKIAELKTTRDNLDRKAREQALHHQQIISLSNHATERINTLYNETVEAFKASLLTHRDDKLTPDCFTDPIPSLKTITSNR